MDRRGKLYFQREKQQKSEKLLVAISNHVAHKKIVEGLYVLVPKQRVLFRSAVLLKNLEQQIVLSEKRPKNPNP